MFRNKEEVEKAIAETRQLLEQAKATFFAHQGALELLVAIHAEMSKEEGTDDGIRRSGTGHDEGSTGPAASSGDGGESVGEDGTGGSTRKRTDPSSSSDPDGTTDNSGTSNDAGGVHSPAGDAADTTGRPTAGPTKHGSPPPHGRTR